MVTAISRRSPGGVTARRSGGRAGGAFRGFGGFEDMLKEAFGGGAARGARTGGFQLADFGGGQDIAASLTITLPEAAGGVKKRVLLPTGKEVDVKIPAGLSEGQTIRLKGQGHHRRRRLQR